MLLEIIFWICLISAVTLVGAEYARRYNRSDLLVAMFATFVILSEIIATKIAKYDLGFMVIFSPAAVIIFSVTFLITDIVNEKFGRAETHRMIFITFLCLLLMLLFIKLATILPGAPFWGKEESWKDIFELVPRITIASLIAYLVSENFDAWSYAKLRERLGRHLWVRNAFSSIPSLGLDTVLFITIAFYGVPGYDIFLMIQGQFILKWLTAIVDIPFMYAARWRMAGAERVPTTQVTSA